MQHGRSRILPRMFAVWWRWRRRRRWQPVVPITAALTLASAFSATLAATAATASVARAALARATAHLSTRLRGAAHGQVPLRVLHRSPHQRGHV